MRLYNNEVKRGEGALRGIFRDTLKKRVQTLSTKSIKNNHVIIIDNQTALFTSLPPP